MTGIIELPDGTVFAAGSVRAVGPLQVCTWNLNYGSFEVIGVGFKVAVYVPFTQKDMDDFFARDGVEQAERLNVRGEAYRKQCIQLLLGEQE